MVDVAAAGRSVLLSSHQIQEVERVADVIAIIRDGSTELPKPPGTVIHRVQQDRQWRLLVRDCDEEQLNQFRASENVAEAELRKPSLEDIYVGFMKSDAAAVQPETTSTEPGTVSV